ncbi:hypothetical protein EJB05_44840, partial [Eragrostis curvula]
MAGGGGAPEGAPIEVEDAAKALVGELLVKRRLLTRSGLRRKAPPTLDNQNAVARQVQAMVLLYNYYHRKQFPQLAFADPKRFILAALLADADLLVYLKHDAEAGTSVTDRAVEDACGIAEALDAKADSPPRTSTWPISKVAVLLVDPTWNKCLIERGSVTKGVWSIFEKDIMPAVSINIDLSAPGARNEEARNSERYMLQTAFSVVESKTGMKHDSLLFLEEHLVYSLSKKETTAKLFVLQYEQTVNSKLTEMPIEDLISRMSGPIFINEACPEMTSVIEYYHILPYKEVLLNLLNRERSLDSSQIIPKEQPLVDETSGINVNLNHQMYASLQSLQKMRNDIVREHCMLGDRSAQLDMDIQTIFTEGKMTPRVTSILRKYEENNSNMMKVATSTSSNMKRKRLVEAVLSRTKCQARKTLCDVNI